MRLLRKNCVPGRRVWKKEKTSEPSSGNNWEIHPEGNEQ
jgi:hypothetical protein